MTTTKKIDPIFEEMVQIHTVCNWHKYGWDEHKVNQLLIGRIPIIEHQGHWTKMRLFMRMHISQVENTDPRFYEMAPHPLPIEKRPRKTGNIEKSTFLLSLFNATTEKETKKWYKVAVSRDAKDIADSILHEKQRKTLITPSMREQINRNLAFKSETGWREPAWAEDFDYEQIDAEFARLHKPVTMISDNTEDDSNMFTGKISATFDPDSNAHRQDNSLAFRFYLKQHKLSTLLKEIGSAEWGCLTERDGWIVIRAINAKGKRLTNDGHQDTAKIEIHSLDESFLKTLKDFTCGRTVINAIDTHYYLKNVENTWEIWFRIPSQDIREQHSAKRKRRVVVTELDLSFAETSGVISEPENREPGNNNERMERIAYYERVADIAERFEGDHKKRVIDDLLNRG